MANEREQNRELTLPPDSFLYMQNVGKGGIITVFRGPAVVNQTGQDQPVRYDASTRTYKPCSLEQAVQQAHKANEGDYAVLENPEEGNGFPSETTQQARKLKKGRKIVIPGPWSEALWPGQSVTVVEGHRLRSNQYIIAIVYNAEEAEANWDKTVVKPQTEDGHGEGEQKQTSVQVARGLPKPDSFAVGTRIVIKGSDVSFFIPCTGVEVLRDENNKYVREAVTLEQLEYCCMIDESGKKEYPRGPAVVFPKPTQTFETDSKNRRKFRPIELNKINGIHLKVTASFEGPDIEKDVAQTRKFEEGEELFVTGKTLSIYYPREELAIIEYGQGNKKHFSTAIPKGEGRYVINRETGEIRLDRGPKMLLADPRIDIPVRRVLSPDEVALWYPNNPEALQYNLDLAEAMAESPSGRSGVVSEGDYRKRLAKRARSGGDPAVSYLASASGLESMQDFREEVGEEGGSTGSITRGTKFTEPRTLTLNTKYDGVPRIEVWPGYAVLIVGSMGSRKVVQGPEVILLEYDEKLGFMELSTSKPKTTDKLFRTAYLCVQNNQVGDIVSFESKDHVKGSVKISLRVNFEAEDEDSKLKWFGVSNYVKYLCDHVRSILAGMAKRHTVAEIKMDYVNLVRSAILGQKSEGAPNSSEPLRTTRPGLYFPDNGMRVVEVEVLDLSLADPSISKLLDAAQHQIVQTNIEIDAARKTLEATKEKERIAQDTARVQHETQQLRNELQKQMYGEQVELIIASIEVELKKLEGEQKKNAEREAMTDLTEQKKLERAKAESEHILSVDRQKLELKKDELDASTTAAVKRLEAAKEGLHEALVALGRDDMAARLAEACNIERFLTGDSLGSSLSNLLGFFPALKGFMDRGEAAQVARTNRLKTAEALPK